MSHIDDTIEQLRFLAENWHRFSYWTRIQIIVTIWWFVRVQRPLRRVSKRLGLWGSHRRYTTWYPVILLFCLSFIGLIASVARGSLQLSLILAVISAGLLAKLVIAQGRRG